MKLSSLKISLLIVFLLSFYNAFSANTDNTKEIRTLSYQAITRGNPEKLEQLLKYPLKDIKVTPIAYGLRDLKDNIERPIPKLEEYLKRNEGENGKNNGQYARVYERLLEFVRKKAKEKDATALIILYVYNYECFKRDGPEVTAAEIKKMADAGNAEAMDHFLTIEGRKPAKDSLISKEDRYDYFKRKAREGDVDAIQMAFSMARDRNNVEDYKEFSNLLLDRFNKDFSNEHAIFSYALDLYNGRFFEKNRDEAIKLIRQAALQVDSEIGLWYYAYCEALPEKNGENTADMERIFNRIRPDLVGMFLNRVADKIKNDPIIRELNSSGEEKRIELLKEAAKLGDMFAMENLSDFYMKQYLSLSEKEKLSGDGLKTAQIAISYFENFLEKKMDPKNRSFAIPDHGLMLNPKFAVLYLSDDPRIRNEKKGEFILENGSKEFPFNSDCLLYAAYVSNLIKDSGGSKALSRERKYLKRNHRVKFFAYVAELFNNGSYGVIPKDGLRYEEYRLRSALAGDNELLKMIVNEGRGKKSKNDVLSILSKAEYPNEIHDVYAMYYMSVNDYPKALEHLNLCDPAQLDFDMAVALFGLSAMGKNSKYSTEEQIAMLEKEILKGKLFDASKRIPYHPGKFYYSVYEKFLLHQKSLPDRRKIARQIVCKAVLIDYTFSADKTNNDELYAAMMRDQIFASPRVLFREFLLRSPSDPNTLLELVKKNLDLGRGESLLNCIMILEVYFNMNLSGLGNSHRPIKDVLGCQYHTHGGIFIESNLGEKSTKDEGIKWMLEYFKYGAQKNDALSLLALSVLHECGKHLSRDLGLSAKYFEKAKACKAEKFQMALRGFANSIKYGNDLVEKNLKRAISFYKQAQDISLNNAEIPKSVLYSNTADLIEMYVLAARRSELGMKVGLESIKAVMQNGGKVDYGFLLELYICSIEEIFPFTKDFYLEEFGQNKFEPSSDFYIYFCDGGRLFDRDLEKASKYASLINDELKRQDALDYIKKLKKE